MPKLKTHTGAKKRFRATARGKIKMTQTGKRHNMRKLPLDRKREAKGTTVMEECDAPRVRRHLAPYGLR